MPKIVSGNDLICCILNDKFLPALAMADCQLNSKAPTAVAHESYRKS